MRDRQTDRQTELHVLRNLYLQRYYRYQLALLWKRKLNGIRITKDDKTLASIEKVRIKIKQRKLSIWDGDLIICGFHRELQRLQAAGVPWWADKGPQSCFHCPQGPPQAEFHLECDLDVTSCTGTGFSKSVVAYSLCRVDQLLYKDLGRCSFNIPMGLISWEETESEG